MLKETLELHRTMGLEIQALQYTIYNCFQQPQTYRDTILRPRYMDPLRGRLGTVYVASLQEALAWLVEVTSSAQAVHDRLTPIRPAFDILSGVLNDARDMQTSLTTDLTHFRYLLNILAPGQAPPALGQGRDGFWTLTTAGRRRVDSSLERLAIREMGRLTNRRIRDIVREWLNIMGTNAALAGTVGGLEAT